jgi:hypothetical protein
MKFKALAKDALSARLRSGDPGRDASLDRAEVARLRLALAEALSSRASASVWPRPALWAAVALTALALALGWRAPRQRGGEVQAVETRPPVEANVKQQLQFETPDGTRIVWVLSPNVPL